MVNSWKSFFYFLLCVTFSVSLVHARAHREFGDFCDIYNENWSCDPEGFSLSENYHAVQRRVIPLDDRELCESDFVGTTLALLEEGDEKIELTEHEEAVFLIGNTGTGKSTLTYFIAGNNSALVSYSVDPVTNLIKDCNGKIGDSTIVSQTIFPDLVVEEVTNTAFYDNPGFYDTRTPCIEIANAYFIAKVVNHVKRVKFVIAVNHASVVPLAARDEFIRTLNNVLAFIPSIKKFLPSVALLGTKVDVAGRDINVRVQQMSQFLTKNKPDLGTVFSEPMLTMVNDLFETLNETNAQGNFTRMHVFRMPEECGPLSGIDHMQENRDRIMNIVMNNLNWTDSSPSDFGLSLSSDANLAIQEISKDLSRKVVASFDQFKAELLEYLRPQFESDCLPASGCDFLIKDLEILFSNPDFAQDYSDESAWQGLNFTEVMNQLVDPIYFPSRFELSANLSESFEKYGRYLDFLNTLQPLPIDISSWFEPLKSFKSQLIQNIRGVAIKWNDGAVELIQTLVTDLQGSLKGQLTLEPGNFDFQSLLDSLQALFSNPDFQSNYNNIDPSVWKGLTFSEIVKRITNPAFLPPVFEISEDVMTGLTNCGQFLGEFQKYVAEPPLYIPLVSWIEPLSGFRGQLLKDLISLSISIDSKIKEAVGQFSSSIILHFEGEAGFECLELMNCGYLTASLSLITTNPDFLDDYANEIWPRLSFTEVVARLCDEKFLPENYTIPIESSLVMERGSSFLDYLKGLLTSESLANVEIGEWLEVMRGFRETLLQSVEEFQVSMREAAFKRSNETVDLIHIFTENLQGFLAGQLNPEDFVFQPLILSIKSLFANPDFQSDYNDNDPSVWNGLTFSGIIERILNSTYLPPLFVIPKNVATDLRSSGKYLDALQTYISGPPLDLPLVLWIKPLTNFKSDLLQDLTSLSIQIDSKIVEAVSEFSSSILEHFQGEFGFKCLDSMNCAYLMASLDRVTTNRDFGDNYMDSIWPRLSFTEVVARLCDEKFLPENYIIPSGPSLIMESGTSCLDYLKSLSTPESLVSVDVGQWLEVMKGFRTSFHQTLAEFEITVTTKTGSFFSAAEEEIHTFFTSKITSADPAVIIYLKDTLVSNYNDLIEISTLETDQESIPICKTFVQKFLGIFNKNTQRISPATVSSLNFQAQVLDSLQKYSHDHSLQNREKWIEGFITIVNSINPSLINLVTCDKVSTPVVVHGFFVSMNSSEFKECFTTAQNNAGSGILISALHTVYLDSSIQSPELNVGIISPNWMFHGATTIDLTGSSGQDFSGSVQDGIDGRPGNPGNPGRNFYGVGLNSFPSSNIGTHSLKIMANGGKGGKGERGGTAGGSNGVDPDMTKVTVELNSNYSPRFVDSPYFAQNLTHVIHGLCCMSGSYISGTTCMCANFQIKGTEGKVGSISRAGNGGKYGKGGLGGTIQVVQVGQTDSCTAMGGSSNRAFDHTEIITPISGQNGAGGEGGVGSGKNGAIIDFVGYKTSSTGSTMLYGLKTYRKSSTSIIENGQSDTNAVGWKDPIKSTIDIPVLKSKFAEVANAQITHTLFGNYINNFLKCVE